MRGPRLAVWMVLCGVALAAAVTAAAQAIGQPPPILHRDVRSPRRGVAGTPPGEKRPPATSSNAVIGDEPAAGRNPAAIGTGEKILPEPPPSEPPAPEEPVMGRSNFGADRETSLEPDANTGPDSRLAYVEAFNPSVVPFKRLTSLGAVREDWTLQISDEHSQSDLRVGGKPTPGFDRFWGSVMIDLTSDVDLPLPSVSPQMRILSYEVVPRTDLIFSSDGADNFYVRSEEPGAKGLHRLVFLVEADPIYFAPRLPRAGMRVYEVARARGAPPLPRLPRDVAEAAREVHTFLRVKSEDPLGATLNRMIAHFRAFEPKDIGAPEGRKLYQTLVVEQAGVCRHRAYAFMITANALGIPTRFVANEAHAFTEVWMPEQGWIRVDLGGASNQLEVRNAEGKSMYRPRGADPFSKPEEYTSGGFSGYSTLRSDKVEGLTEEQKSEGRTPREGADGSGDGSGSGPDPNGAVDPNFDPDDQNLDDAPRPAPGDDRPAIPEEARKGKKETAIAVTGATPVGFRGEAIEVSGEVRDADGKGLSGLPIDVYLAPAGAGGNRAQLVGHTVSGPGGAFSAEVVVPYGLSLEPHEVYAATGGDREQQPAVSN